MTKRDFVMIAAVMLYARPEKPPHDKRDPNDTGLPWERYAAARDTWERAVREFARQLQGVNPRFDRERFFNACGMEE